jgi:deferrochelatase/peroxidase EfeB
LGPALFRDRFGLAGRRPPALEQLPPFAGEDLDPAQSNGDLCVQACADDPQVAFHAIHVLARVAGSDASLRWVQVGFRPGAATVADGETRRNLIGFKDGTENIAIDDRAALDRFVWVQRGDGPAWMAGGTYVIARRVEIVLSSWDGLTRAAQERAIGRHKLSGAPLGAHHERDPLDLGAKGPDGQPRIPLDAHVRVAAPESNAGQRILRRGYSFSQSTRTGGTTQGGRELDGRLFFIAFVRNPARQFIPIQRRLSTGDALSAFTEHTASAIFACPPGARSGGFVADRLFA